MPVTRIVLDTTELRSDPRLIGTAFRVVFDAIERGGFLLDIPCVVYDEFMNQFVEALTETEAKLQSNREALERLSSDSIDIELDEDWIAGQLAEYELHVTQVLGRVQATVLPYPTLEHKELVARDLSRRKPFARSGKGYRDALIWETVLRLGIDNPEDQILLVSSNTSDFAQADGVRLHADLLADFESRGLKSESIAFVNGLAQLTDVHLSPELERLDNVQARINAGGMTDWNLKESIHRELERTMADRGSDWSRRDLGLPGGAETVNFVHVEEPTALEITSVHRLSQGELWLEASVEVECAVDFFLHKSDYYSPDDCDFEIEDRDWNEHYLWARADRTLRAEIQFTVDEETKSISSFDLMWIEPKDS